MEVASSVVDRPSTVAHEVRCGDDTVRFRRNYLLGRWAAQQQRLDGANADLYGLELARFGARAAGEDAVVNIVRADIAACDGETSHSIIRRRLQQFEQQAAAELGPDAYVEAA